MLIRSSDTPKLPIYIRSAAALTPVSGLGGGQPYYINPSGSSVATTNTLVEVDAVHAKGWYTLQLDLGDSLSPGNWRIVYQTPTTFANVGDSEFTVDAPTGNSVPIAQPIDPLMFVMRDSTTHQPVIGATVTAERSLNGGVFDAGTMSAVVEVGNGWYKLTMNNGDTDARIIAFRAIAAGCDDTNLVIVTHP